MIVYRRHLALAALLTVLGAGCSSGGSGPQPTVAGADAIVVMKPASTDLNALDLRDKLLTLGGVDGVVYDQALKRLRVDFTDDATDAQRRAASDAASADPAVETVTTEGGAPGPKPPQQQPAPSATSSSAATAPSPS